MFRTNGLFIEMGLIGLAAPVSAQHAPHFEVVDYEYYGDCDNPFVEPSIGADGNTLEVPFEGSDFDAFAELPDRSDKAECVVFVTVRVPYGVRISPDFIDIVGEADLDEGARGRVSAQYRFLNGAQSPVAAVAYSGEFVGGVRVQSPRTREAGWSECGATEVTFRVSSAARVRLRGDAEFGEINMTNGVGSQLVCGYHWSYCW